MYGDAELLFSLSMLVHEPAHRGPRRNWGNSKSLSPNLHRIGMAKLSKVVSADGGCSGQPWR